MGNFLNYKMLIGSTALVASFLINGCSDTETNIIEPNLAASISGKAVLADGADPVKSALVKLRIGGTWYQTYTTGGDGAEAGDFIFSNVPINAEFYLSIDPAEDGLATSYTTGSTNASDSNITPTTSGVDFQGNILSKDIGLTHIYQEKATTLTVLDVTSGDAISGLGLWTEVPTIGTGNPGATNVSAPYIQPEEASGVYTFQFPDHGQAIDIYANDLIANGVQYQFLDGNQLSPGGNDGFNDGLGGHTETTFRDQQVATLYPEDAVTIYLRQSTTNSMTVVFDLFDVDGNPYSQAGTAIAVRENGANLSAVQDTTVTNRYSLTTDYRRNLSYVIPSMDLDGDGYADTSTAIINGGNVVQRGQAESGFAVTITEITANTPLTVQVLGSNEFVAGEAYVVFNQPVELVGDIPALVNYALFNGSATAEQSDRIAPFGNARDAATDTFQFALTQNPNNNGNNSQWGYTDNTSASAVFTLTGAQTTDGTIVDPFTTRVAADSTISSATLTSFNGSNSIYKVTFDASAVSAEMEVALNATVRVIDGVDTQVVRAGFVAVPNQTIALGDLVVDNGDYDNTTTLNIVNNNVTPFVADNEKLRYNLPNTSGLFGCLSVDCKFAAADPQTTEQTDLGEMTNTLAIISPMPMTGSIKLISYVVESVDTTGGVTTETTELFGNEIYLYSDASELTELTAGNNDYCSTIANCSEQGMTKLFLPDPSNQNMTDKSGGSLSSVYGTNNVGFAKGYMQQSGLGYVYDLQDFGLPSVVASTSFLKSVKFDIDVVANGQSLKGTLDYAVQ
ncbi:MAG: hypothetical protein ACJASL_004148 [Paraglaciecola sp.]|jgi:hypothetical protein